MNTTSHATVASLMSRPVATVDHTVSLRQAAEELAAGGIGALVVLHGTSAGGGAVRA